MNGSLTDYILGVFEGIGKNALFIGIGGMHGNEKGGIVALDRVLGLLKNANHKFKGKFIAIQGNLNAIENNTRFLKRDLNRIWTETHLKKAYNGVNVLEEPEYKHLRALHTIIEGEIAKGYEKVVIMDLHTTSANGGVFIVCPNEERNKKIVSRLLVPVVLDLEKNLKGTALGYYWDKGHVAFAFEGGNHYSPDSIDKMESAIWLALEYLECIDRNDYDNIEYHELRLIHSTAELPHFCQLKYHHVINVGDNFKMKPGYTNFQRVVKDETLAKDKNGIIKCPQDGLMLMPLYQDKGEDGFFIIEEVNNSVKV